MSMSESIKTIPVYLIAIIGMYISLNAVLAIPLLDESNSKLKEMGSDLKDELNASKLSFINHLNDDFKYDSIVNFRFDSASKKIGINSSSVSLSIILSNKINNYKRSFENGRDLIYYDFIGLNSSNSISEAFSIKNSLSEIYKLKCDSAEKNITFYLNTVRININRFYSLTRIQNTAASTMSEAYIEVYKSLYIDELPISFSGSLITKTKKDPFNSFFYISNLIVLDGSTSINIIIAIFGVALFGCVIGSYRRNTIEKTLSNPLAVDIAPLLFKSFSASLITYLSIKGGVSVIAADKGTEINPYFIMLVCFAAAVYSDEIWVWAKGKFIPTNSSKKDLKEVIEEKAKGDTKI